MEKSIGNFVERKTKLKVTRANENVDSARCAVRLYEKYCLHALVSLVLFKGDMLLQLFLLCKSDSNCFLICV